MISISIPFSYLHSHVSVYGFYPKPINNLNFNTFYYNIINISFSLTNINNEFVWLQDYNTPVILGIDKTDGKYLLDHMNNNMEYKGIKILNSWKKQIYP